MGEGWEAKGDLEKASECYQKAIGFDPEEEIHQTNLKRVYEKIGKGFNLTKILEEFKHK